MEQEQSMTFTNNGPQQCYGLGELIGCDDVG